MKPWHEIVFAWHPVKYGFYMSLIYFYRFRDLTFDGLKKKPSERLMVAVTIYFASCLWPIWVAVHVVRLVIRFVGHAKKR